MKNGLFAIKGFLPFILIMFINASVDLGHKITIQNILVKSYDGDTLVILTAIVNLLILLPYIMFFSAAGFLNDKFSRTKITRYSAIVAVFITAFITIFYYFGWFKIAFFMTLLLAIQSAIYSPAKYGLIKKIVGAQKLGAANGVVQAITIVSILASSLIFAIVFEKYALVSKDPAQMISSVWFIGLILFIGSILEAYFTFKIPYFEADFKDAKFSWKKYLKFEYLRENLNFITSDKNTLLCTLGLSMFWAVSQLVIATFPSHYKMLSGVSDVGIIQAVLAMSAVGLVIGSSVAGAYSKNHLEMGIVPFGAFGIFASLLIFAYSTTGFWMVFASLFFGFSGGIFIVPLNASVQFFTEEKRMGRVLAGSNFFQNIGMILALAFTIFMASLDISNHNSSEVLKTRYIFLFSAFFVLFCAILATRFLPHLFCRILVLPFFKLRYRINVDGVENIPQRGGVLLLGNHISWIDWAVLQMATPRPIKFVMHKSFYDLWYLRWFFKAFRVIPIGSAGSKGSISKISEVLKNGEVVALFPEGHISYNGQIDEFKKGFELAIKDTGAVIVPFYMRGLWGSSFSRAEKYYKKMSTKDGKRDIRIAFGKIMPENSSASEVKKSVTEMSFVSWGEYLKIIDPIHVNWLKNAKSNLFKRAMVDSTGKDLNNLKVIAAVLLFLNKFQHKFRDEKNIGILLPSSVMGSVINLVMLAKGKVAVNLNYTLSEQILLECVKKAEIKTIVSSKQFVQKLKSKGFDLEDCLNDKLLYLEDIAQEISKSDRIYSILKAIFMPKFLIKFLYFNKANLDDEAAILFSSGSEGNPKGIVLTHKNLMSNIKQISELLNIIEEEVILASLPIFHSFGLTATAFLPLSEGIVSVHVPDPTDANLVGKMTAKYHATIMFGTSTFFRLYTKSKKINPLMLKSIRYAVSGAEKLNQAIKKEFKIKFGIDIYEAYGTTETTPLVSSNMPNILEPEFLKELVFTKEGSVGLPVPGTIVKIVDQNSYEELKRGENGLILIGGHQVMKGYFKDEKKTNDAIICIDGVRYYKTGDIGNLDEDGFLFITDRISRFAKIGGEMISLSRVEMELSEILTDEVKYSCVNLKDDKKGEKIVLIYEGDIDENDVKQKIKASNIVSIMQPSEIRKVDEIPVLGTGKINFREVKALAQSLEA